MQKTFDFIADAGHGWAKVPRALLRDLGIEAQISHYSYQRGDWVYLEEDCDLSRFHIEYRTKYGIEPRYRERNTSSRKQYSWVRNYPQYQPQQTEQ
jgi:hypothetical protein